MALPGSPVLALIALVLSAPSCAQDGSTPWRGQSRHESGWVSPKDAATYRGIAPSESIPRNSPSFTGLDPALQVRVERVFEAARREGIRVAFISGYRPEAHQREMGKIYASGQSSGIQFKPATSSRHPPGFAVDLQVLNPDKLGQFVKIVHDNGLAFPVLNDPNHIELVQPVLEPTKHDGMFVSVSQLTEGLPQFDRCQECRPRVVFPPPSDVAVTERVKREYQAIAESQERQRALRRQLLPLERPSRHARSDVDRYRSWVGIEYRFDDPFGSRPALDEGVRGNFGNWNFDKLDGSDPKPGASE